jgi:LmbE family N-acetylglucosaminyl deacetylase
MANFITAFCLLFLAGTSAFTQSKKQKTIVAIFAHPDDESAIGDVLAKYARLGHTVQVIIATDGKDGTRVTKIPAGDSLGNLRKQESICACAKLNILPPIFLSVERLETKIGVGPYFREHKKLLLLLKEHLSKINPDLIITFGPDGDTHHSEHIVIGATVTELLLAEGWVDKYPLYYVVWSKEQGLQNELGWVNDEYITIRATYTDEDERKSLEAMKCYITQLTAAEIKEDFDKKIKDRLNTTYFRQFVVEKKKRIKKEFF